MKPIHHRTRTKYKGGGSFTQAEWDALCATFDHRCVCCGQRDPLVVDHIIPVSENGSSNIENIQPLCRSCNMQKHARTIDFRDNPFQGFPPTPPTPPTEGRIAYDSRRTTAQTLLVQYPDAGLWDLSLKMAAIEGCDKTTAWRHLKRAKAGTTPPRWGGPPDPVAAQMRTILVTSNQVAALPFIEAALQQCFNEEARGGLEELLAGIWAAREA